MNEQFDGWQRSSHRAVAGCNDCHAPHTFLGKYATKASNGFWHSFAFTTGDFPDPIRIKDHNREVTDQRGHGSRQAESRKGEGGASEGAGGEQ